jgi:hypothetical protein
VLIDAINYNYSISPVTGYVLDDLGSIHCRDRNFSLHHSVQRPIQSTSKGNENSLPGVKLRSVKLLIHPHLVSEVKSIWYDTFVPQCDFLPCGLIIKHNDFLFMSRHNSVSVVTDRNGRLGFSS